jgi:hypothetical protein
MTIRFKILYSPPNIIRVIKSRTDDEMDVECGTLRTDKKDITTF